MALLTLRSLFEVTSSDRTFHINGVSGQPEIGSFHVEGGIVVAVQPISLTAVSPIFYGGKPIGKPGLDWDVQIQGVFGEPTIGYPTVFIAIAPRDAIRSSLYKPIRTKIHASARYLRPKNRTRKFVNPRIGMLLRTVPDETMVSMSKHDLTDEEIIALIHSAF